MATRQDIIDATATVLEIEPDQLDLQKPLIDQGMDSLRLISLIEELRSRDLEIDFFVISTLPTLEQWFPALGLEEA